MRNRNKSSVTGNESGEGEQEEEETALRNAWGEGRRTNEEKVMDKEANQQSEAMNQESEK